MLSTLIRCDFIVTSSQIAGHLEERLRGLTGGTS